MAMTFMPDKVMSYFVYRHIRPDTNQVFYIGRGKVYTRSSPTFRAFDTRRRNAVWKRVVEKNGGIFEVEIMFWSNDRDVILQKESEFITLYGRITNGGTLVNLTDGGDGSLGLRHTKETRERLCSVRKAETWRADLFRSESFKAARKLKVAHLPSPTLGKRYSIEARKKMSDARKGSLHSEAKVVIDNATGKQFGCVEDAARFLGVKKWSLYKQLSGERPNRTTMKYAAGNQPNSQPSK